MVSSGNKWHSTEMCHYHNPGCKKKEHGRFENESIAKKY